jgi:hypothetical protein
MAKGFKQGHKKVGGRAKGSPNKKTVEFLQLLDKYDFDPGAEYILLYRDIRKVINFRKKKGNLPGALEAMDVGNRALNNICQFVYPRKKAIDHSGSVDVNNFAQFMAEMNEQDED